MSAINWTVNAIDLTGDSQYAPAPPAEYSLGSSSGDFTVTLRLRPPEPEADEPIIVEGSR